MQVASAFGEPTDTEEENGAGTAAADARDKRAREGGAGENNRDQGEARNREERKATHQAALATCKWLADKA